MIEWNHYFCRVNVKLLLTYFCLFAFCLRFSYLIEHHEHRSESEICILEHSAHIHLHSACEIADILGWENEHSCNDKAHLKEAKHHCGSCGFDFTKYFENTTNAYSRSSSIVWMSISYFTTNIYRGFTHLLCNKGPPEIIS